MFLELLYFLNYNDISSNEFNYLILRALFAMLSAFLIIILTGKKTIAILKNNNIGEFIRNDGPKSHHTKKGTATMGGILIIFAFIASSLIWVDLKNIYLWVIIFTTISFALIGFVDDYVKFKQISMKGISAYKKFIAQSVLSLIIIAFLIYNKSAPLNTDLFIPFIKYDLKIYLALFVIIAYLLIVGTSNSTNLTDGLDGILTILFITIAIGIAIFAYISGNYDIANNFNIPYVEGAQELFIILAALIGAGLGFLWFNAPPATIFMGDIGSLSIGATLAVIILIIRQELLFILMSGVLIAETLSVIIQVNYHKITKKRIFLMSPLHHHFEKKGLAEAKITIRFWIVTLILVIIALTSIKFP